MGLSITIKQSLYGLILSFVGLLCLPTSVAAENRILEKAQWEDTSAQVSFEQLICLLSVAQHRLSCSRRHHYRQPQLRARRIHVHFHTPLFPFFAIIRRSSDW